jgi:DoxX-like family
MSNSRNWFKIGGLVLHVLIAALMIFASLGKLTGTPPAEVVESLRKAGLEEQLRLIGCGELITAILLIVPWTASLGVLLASAFWGGAICTHMGLHTSYVFQSVLLALTWVGAYLRIPAMFSSFWPTSVPASGKVDTSASSLA